MAYSQAVKPLSLWSLFQIFAQIGCVGFGATIAAESKKKLVTQLQWVSEEDFVTGLALAQILPGATFVSLTVYLGYRLRGMIGAVTSFAALLVAPFFLMLLLSTVYFSYSFVPQVGIAFKGLAIVVVGVVAHAVIEIGKTVITDRRGVFIALAAGILMVYYSNLIVILLLAAVAGVILYWRPLPGKRDRAPRNSLSVKTKAAIGKQGISFGIAVAVVSYCATSKLLLFQLGAIFFRMGACLFGGGFSMLPLIQQEVVTHYQWLTVDEFIVGIALGQVTPGPILIIATFIGYKLASVNGALVATLGIFLPSLFLVPAAAEFYQVIQNNSYIQAALKGIAATLAGTMAVFALSLMRYSLVDLPSVSLAAGAFGVLRTGKGSTIEVLISGTILYSLIAI